MNQSDYDADLLATDSWNPDEQIVTDSWNPDEESYLPEHLVRLPDKQWAIWRWGGLRGAGFPAHYLHDLAAPECAAAADRLHQAEDEVQQALEGALAAVNGALDALRRDNAWDDLKQREPLLNALRQLRQGKLPATADLPADITAAVAALQAARARLDAARPSFAPAFQAASNKLSQAIARLARDETIREAITWQNRRAIHTGVNDLLRETPEGGRRSSRHRQHEQLIANYVQRYSAKNDTIGFFGPLGWVHFVDHSDTLNVQPGPSLLATRAVYFESWCIDTLAQKFSETRAMLPWATPRRVPALHIEGVTVYQPFEAPLKLSADQAAVLQACDGTRTAKDLAAELSRSLAGGTASERDVYSILGYLRDIGLIVWAFEVPFELHPERSLRRLVERIDDEALRNQALGQLSELESARTAIAQAAGNAEQLDHALSQIEETFTRITGAAATRSHGKMYAARTLVYEDCRRNIEVELGPQIVESLGPPLALLLTSARWFTFQLAIRFREGFKKLYDELARELRTPVIDLATFWARAQPLLFGEVGSPLAAVTPLFQERWAQLLDIPAGQRQVVYQSADIRPLVEAAFDAPNAGWLSARHHSPDIMIAAQGAEAIRRGDYQFVMGELHAAFNTLAGSCFMSQHPYPEDLFLAIELDFPETRLVPIVPRDWVRVTTRTRVGLISPSDYRLMYSHDSGGIPKSRAIPIGAMVVDYSDGELVTRTRDGRLRFDLLETFSQILSLQAVSAFRVLPPSSYSPRVSFDRLVVSREAWGFTPAEIPFAFVKDEAERFLAARRWARERGMPQRVFAKSPVEVKPCYIDFNSPIYVEIFAKTVRRTAERGGADARIGVSEMLPDLDQLWLPDAEGRMYTSEMRLVAVDLANQADADSF